MIHTLDNSSFIVKLDRVYLVSLGVCNLTCQNHGLLFLLFKNNLIDAANLRVRHKLPTKAHSGTKFSAMVDQPNALKAEASVNDMDNPIPKTEKPTRARQIAP